VPIFDAREAHREPRIAFVIISFVFTMSLVAQVEEREDPSTSKVPAVEQVPPLEAVSEAPNPRRTLKMVTESQTSNYIAKFDGIGAGTVGDSVMYENDGNVGVGTTNPQARLHLHGSSNQDGFAGMGPDLVAGPAMNFGYAGSSSAGERDSSTFAPIVRGGRPATGAANRRGAEVRRNQQPRSSELSIRMGTALRVLNDRISSHGQHP
jgi:hypothetical protein